jgi:hypothetical protein
LNKRRHPSQHIFTIHGLPPFHDPFPAIAQCDGHDAPDGSTDIHISSSGKNSDYWQDHIAEFVELMNQKFRFGPPQEGAGMLHARVSNIAKQLSNFHKAAITIHGSELESAAFRFRGPSGQQFNTLKPASITSVFHR